MAELKNRGLVVNDDDCALDYLGSINYFRFACYLQPFEVDATTHQYAAGTSFDQIVELYQFDKELRGLIFTAIQNVEIAAYPYYPSLLNGSWHVLVPQPKLV